MTVAQKFDDKQNYKNFEIRAFMKRIIKLLILGIKPVFVFEGEPPKLKSKTLLRRKLRKFQTNINYKKLAERHILRLTKDNQDKQRKLEEVINLKTSPNLTEIDENEIQEISALLKEFEEIYEEEERREQETLKKIFLEQNKELIAANGYKIKEFSTLNQQVQEELVLRWKDALAHQKRSQYGSEGDYEKASKLQFQNYLTKAAKEEEMIKYKEKIGQKIEDEDMLKNLNIDDSVIRTRDLVFRNRVDWQKDKVLYLFGAKSEGNGRNGKNGLFDKDGVFRAEKRRYKTKRERLQEIENQRSSLGSHLILMDMNDGKFVNEMLQTCSSILTRSLMGEKAGKEEVVRRRVRDGRLKLNTEQKERKEMRLRWERHEAYEAMKRDCPGIKGIDELVMEGDADSVGSFDVFGEDRVSLDLGDSGVDQEVNRGGKGVSEGVEGVRGLDGGQNSAKSPKNGDFRKRQNSTFLGNSEQPSAENSFSQAPRPSTDTQPAAKTAYLTEQFVKWVSEEEQFMNQELPFLDESKHSTAHQKPSTLQTSNIFEYFGGGFEDTSEDPKQQEQRFEKLKTLISERRSLEIASQTPKTHENSINESDAHSHLKLLLKLFGVPWVESFGEAEAQCAKLEQLGLVDATVTEDSDSFLFGSKKVYKNLFSSHGSGVLEFDIRMIRRGLGLTREKLIMLALFLGCDYTDGVKGVGLVNGMEIVSCYETFESLERWREWAEKPDLWLNAEKGAEMHQIYEKAKIEFPVEFKYMMDHKNYKNVWEVPEDFPSREVIDGFLKPRVKADFGENGFEWREPDFGNLRLFCAEIMEMEEYEVDHIVKPLQKEFENRRIGGESSGKKGKITGYFGKGGEVGEVVSERLKAAVKTLRVGGGENGAKEKIGGEAAEAGEVGGGAVEGEEAVAGAPLGGVVVSENPPQRGGKKNGGGKKKGRKGARKVKKEKKDKSAPTKTRKVSTRGDNRRRRRRVYTSSEANTNKNNNNKD